MFFFFAVPLVGMAVTSVQAPGGGVTLEHYESLASGRRWLALRNSLFISSISSLVAAILGTVIAWAISHINSRTLNAVTGVMSSVLANSGGAALAFSFIVLFGNAGYLISFIVGLDSGFTLYSSKGLVLMYQYFLIPTMVLLLLPSMQALRMEWKEANASLGGSQWMFWRKVGIPILSPAIIGGFVLLFGSAFATHASAAVLLGSGAFPLITLQIANELGGSASVGGQNAAMAMGLVTAVIAIVVLIVFNLLQGRSQKWLQR
jgi:putative spermidine/putrescine transport system permease protein